MPEKLPPTIDDAASAIDDLPSRRSASARMRIALSWL